MGCRVNAAELYDRVFDIYKKTFAKQLGYAAVVGLASVFSLGLLVLGITIVSLTVSPAGFSSAGTVTAISMISVIVPFVLIWQAASSAGAILFSRQAFLGERIKLPTQDLFRIICRAAGALFAQLILAVPYLAIAGGFVYFLFQYIPAFGYLWLSRVYMVLFIALLAVCVAGFFIYMHVFSLAIAAAVNERVSFFEAVRRSFVLIKNDFWRLFGLRVLWFVMILVLAASAQGVLALLPVIAGWFAAGWDSSVRLLQMLQFLTGLLSVAVTFALGPLDGILTAVIYFNQRMKREGLRDAV